MAAYRESSPVAKIDPIFAAIDAHCAAVAAYHAWGAVDASDAVMDAAIAVEGKVLGALLDSRAVTLTGLLASAGAPRATGISDLRPRRRDRRQCARCRAGGSSAIRKFPNCKIDKKAKSWKLSSQFSTRSIAN
jgi:hypothetical protein